MNLIPLLFGVLLAGIFYAVQKWKVFAEYRDRLDKLPGPKGSILGNGSDIKYSLFPDFVYNKWSKKYGGLYRIWILRPFIGAVVLSDPELIKFVLVTQNYDKSSFLYRGVRDVLGTGLIMSHGRMWELSKVIFVKALHRQCLKDMVPKMVAILHNFNKLLDTYTPQSEVPPFTPAPGGYVNMVPLFIRMTIDIISENAFGYNMNIMMDPNNTLANTFLEIFKEIGARILDVFRRFYNIPAALRYRNNLNTLRKEFKIILDKKRAEMELKKKTTEEKGNQTEEEETNFLALLLSAKDDDGKPFSEDHIMDELATFFAGGNDSTSNLMSFVLYNISQHPEVERKLLNEFKTILNGRDPTFDDIAKMTYALGVLRETLRLYPVGTTARTLTEDVECGNHTIPKGTIALISGYTMSHDPKYWKEPEVFNPERWLNTDDLENNVYIPFSEGPRSCPGEKLALTEGRVILSMILPKFKFRMAPGSFPKYGFFVTNRPVDGMWMTIERRKPEDM